MSASSSLPRCSPSCKPIALLLHRPATVASLTVQFAELRLKHTLSKTPAKRKSETRRWEKREWSRGNGEKDATSSPHARQDAEGVQRRFTADRELKPRRPAGERKRLRIDERSHDQRNLPLPNQPALERPRRQKSLTTQRLPKRRNAWGAEQDKPRRPPGERKQLPIDELSHDKRNLPLPDQPALERPRRQKSLTTQLLPKRRNEWGAEQGMTADEERGFKEIEDVWERLETAEMVYEKDGTPVVLTASGVEEVNESKEEKQERLFTAANLGASKVLRWLRSVNSAPVCTRKADEDGNDVSSFEPSTLDKLLTANLCRSLCRHLEAERLVESFHNCGKLSPSPILDWINDGQDAIARAPPGAIYHWPDRLLKAHLRATLYWHESPDVSIDVLSRFQGQTLTKRLTVMLCTSSQIRNPCEKNESYDKFLGLELSRLQRATAMLWHPTDPDALPLSNFYIAMQALLKDSGEEACALTTLNIPIHSKFDRDIIRAQYLLLLQNEEHQVESLLQSMPMRVTDVAAQQRRVQQFKEYRHDPRLQKLHERCPRLEKIWYVLNAKEAVLQRRVDQAGTSGRKGRQRLLNAMKPSDIHRIWNVLNDKKALYERGVQHARKIQGGRKRRRLQRAREQTNMYGVWNVVHETKAEYKRRMKHAKKMKRGRKARLQEARLQEARLQEARLQDQWIESGYMG